MSDAQSLIPYSCDVFFHAHRLIQHQCSLHLQNNNVISIYAKHIEPPLPPPTPSSQSILINFPSTTRCDFTFLSILFSSLCSSWQPSLSKIKQLQIIKQTYQYYREEESSRTLNTETLFQLLPLFEWQWVAVSPSICSLWSVPLVYATIHGYVPSQTNPDKMRFYVYKNNKIKESILCVYPLQSKQTKQNN